MSSHCSINLNYYWNIGFLLSLFYSIQIYSGIILSTSYTNDVTLAFYSLSYLVREINNGWSFRYIHSQGASFLFALTFLHLARSFVYSSCFFLPLTYFSGYIIFIILIFIAFIGYVLPWGLMGFWGATVITNLLSPVSNLVEWICGGYYLSTPTLKRFFLLHFIFPFLSFSLIIIHIFYLHLQGSNNPLGVNINNNIGFFPYFLSKDIFGFFSLTTLITYQVTCCILLLSHPDNAIMAGNGFLTPLHILPEWYFLPFYAILKALPNKNAGSIILLIFSFYPTFLISLNWNSHGRLNRSLSQFPSFLYLVFAQGWIGSCIPEEKFISYGRIFLILTLFALYVLDLLFWSL